MKKVTFERLTLTDWRAQKRTICFKDRNIIRGKNESGKSTTWDAIMWVLTGYDSLDRSNYDLFDNRISYTRENSTPAIVELVMTIDGNSYTLRREAKIGWIRSRGETEYTRKGSDDYSFFIDGVEVSAKNYREFIETNLCPVEKLKFILNIGFYEMIDWKTLRSHFADIIGDVKESDFSSDFSEVFESLKKYTVDALKERIRNEYNPLRIQVRDVLPQTIEVLTANLPDISQVEYAKNHVLECRAKIEELDRRMSDASKSLQPYVEKREKEMRLIEQIKSEINEKRIKYETETNRKIAEIQAKVDSVDSSNEIIARLNRENADAFERLHRTREELSRRLDSMKSEIESLREENKAIKEKVFTAEKCSFCGQELPENMLDKLKQDFLKEKETRHQAIVKRGLELKEAIGKAESEIREIDARIEKGFETKPLQEKESLMEELQKARHSSVPFEMTSEYATLNDKVSGLTSALTEIPKIDTSEIEAKKKEIMEEMSRYTEIASCRKEFDRQMSVIETKRTELKNGTIKLAELEGFANKLIRMEKEKAEIIKNRISSLFSVCTVEMEEMKKDGTKIPACNIYINGVKAQVSNTANKMKAGMDISDAICKAYGINMPLIVDNAERLDKDNSAISTDRQLIMMRVEDVPFTME